MKDWTFILAHGLVSWLFLLVGLLALLLSEKNYSRMLGRFLPPGRASGLQRRLVGLVLALMGFFGAKADLLSIYSSRLPRQAQGAATPTSAGHLSWSPFVLGLLVVGAGFFVAMNPEVLVRWSQQHLFPDRQMPEGVVRTWRLVLRATGALMIYSSGHLFKLWMSH